MTETTNHRSSWTLTVPAPFVKAVRKKKTGKMFQRTPFLNLNDRDHFRVTTPIKADWRRAANNAARDADLPKGLPRVRIDATINKPRAGSYDAMNYYATLKPIVDGLIDYGICEDDSNEFVEGPFITEGIKGPAAVNLTITILEEK